MREYFFEDKPTGVRLIIKKGRLKGTVVKGLNHKDARHNLICKLLRLIQKNGADFSRLSS
jgi:hypothetical protein